MLEKIATIAVFWWMGAIAAFFVMWFSLLTSIFNKCETDKECARKVFISALLTFVLLGIIGWTMHTQLDTPLFIKKSESAEKKN